MKDEILQIAGEPVAWLVVSKHGLVRACWTSVPSDEQLAVAEGDGDTITPLRNEAQLLDVAEGAYAKGAATGSDELLQKILADYLADGWRQCAVGQRTTQFCGQVEAEKAKAYAKGAEDRATANERIRELEKLLEDANRGAQRNALINQSLAGKLIAERAISDKLEKALRMIATATGDSACDDGCSPEELACTALTEVAAMRKGAEHD